MLSLETIAALVGPWHNEGRISQVDFDRLKVQYLAEIGAPVSGCTTCQSFRSDVLHHFRFKLRQNNIPIMESTRKYILADEVGSLSLPDDTRLIVNEAGDDEENRRPLTDELAEALMERDEAYKQFIVPNPAYKEPAATKPAPVKPVTPPAPPKPKAPAAPKGGKAAPKQTAPAPPATQPTGGDPALIQPGTDTSQPDLKNAQKAADGENTDTNTSANNGEGTNKSTE